MHLKDFAPATEGKFVFDLQHNGELQSIVLREKGTWPVILNQTLGSVEEWLFNNYLSACYLAF